MDNPEKLATQDTQDEENQNTTQHNTTQHNIRWTPLYVNKHKQRKLDKGHHTNVCII